MKALNLWDEVFHGVTVVEAINQKDLVNSIAWLAHNRKITLSEGAMDFLKLKAGWKVWAKVKKPKKLFVR